MGPRIHPKRAAYEFYPTPPKATRALLSAEEFDGSIWEPACGEGHIAKVLLENGHDVVSTDLVDYGFGEADRDFLGERRPLAKHIVTNPPYGRGLADAFVRHALRLTKETGGKVAMLMNLSGLCHPIRHDFYVGNPPAVIYALDECACWSYGDPGRATTSIAKQRYCWMIWRHDYPGATEFRWLSTREFKY
ncbi:SAM-dependent methyltransferase [Methyloligella halotolerans]|nr:SAM-dependent methyltransferase [Methyloligella halotolerans]